MRYIPQVQGIGGRSLSELPSSGALRALIGKDDAVPDGPLDMDYQRTVAEVNDLI